MDRKEAERSLCGAEISEAIAEALCIDQRENALLCAEFHEADAGSKSAGGEEGDR